MQDKVLRDLGFEISDNLKTVKGSNMGEDSVLRSMGFELPESFDEDKFQSWYKGWADYLKINPDPDAPEHFYDYRAAYRSGAAPSAESNWHWPSQFKKEGHPNLIVDGIDTRTGKKAVNLKAYDPVSIMSKAIVPANQAAKSSGAAIALNKLWGLAKNPYDIIKGSAEFVSAIPGFALGMGKAMWNMSEAIGKGANLDQAYEAASKGMEDYAKRWHQTMVEPLGRLVDSPRRAGKYLASKITGKESAEEKSYSDVVGDIAMAPLDAVVLATHSIADYKWLDDRPNVRGAIKFGGDVLGLLTIGRLYRGGASEYAKDVEPIINKAKDINEKQKVVDEISESVIKQAQQKVLDVEKVQLDLEAKKIQDKLDHEKIVAEDLRVKGEEIKDAKTYRVEDLIAEGKVRVVKEGKKSGIDLLDEQKVSFKEFVESKGRSWPVKTTDPDYASLMAEYEGKGIEKKDRSIIEQTETEQKKVNVQDLIKEGKVRVITDLDELTGTPTPKKLKGDDHPLRDTLLTFS